MEAGAYDGITESNSLFFELERNYTGVLIEPDPENLVKLLELNRNAYVVNACISTGPKAMKVRFVSANEMTIAQSFTSKKRNMMMTLFGHNLHEYDVWCFPAQSILQALGINHVQFFSLDTEAGELEILLSFPHSEITVDSWLVEYTVGNGFFDQRRSMKQKQDIVNLMSHSYELEGEIALDLLFRNKQCC